MSVEIDFLKGGDISLLQTIEDHGGVYRENGEAKDALEIFKSHGMNWMRLRLFHTPSGEGPVCNDLDYTLALGQRIKNAGLGLLLNFHYSDTWADPGKQHKPEAWKKLSYDKLKQAVHDYTRDVIAAFRDAGELPDMVQVGNEITPGMLWNHGRVGGKRDTPEQWARFAGLVQAGIDGVRAGAGEGAAIPIMIHIDRGGDAKATRWFFDNLLEQGVDFDVIGQSYYPFWHGTFDDLRANLESTAERYNKDIIVVETGSPWVEQEMWRGKKPMGLEESRRLLPYPMTPEGQKQFLDELIRRKLVVARHRGDLFAYALPRTHE